MAGEILEFHFSVSFVARLGPVGLLAGFDVANFAGRDLSSYERPPYTKPEFFESAKREELEREELERELSLSSRPMPFWLGGARLDSAPPSPKLNPQLPRL